MTSDWQTIVVAIAVLWSAVFVVRRLTQLWRKPTGGCGSGGDCDACPSGSKEAGNLVSLELPPQASHGQAANSR